MKKLIKQILKEETDNLPQDSPIIQAILSIIPNEFEGVFFQPWDENHINYIIRFHITKITMWSTQGYEERDPLIRSIYHPKPDSLFEGTVYVKIDTLLVGNQREDEWERMYGEDDITETAWDDFAEYISGTITKWLPKVNVDVDINF